MLATESIAIDSTTLERLSPCGIQGSREEWQHNQIAENDRESRFISFITYVIISNLAPKRFLSRKWQEGRASSREINSWLSRWLTQVREKTRGWKSSGKDRESDDHVIRKHCRCLPVSGRCAAWRTRAEKIEWTERRCVCLTAQRLSKHWRPLPIMAARNRAVQVSLPPPPSPPRAPRSHLYR